MNVKTVNRPKLFINLNYLVQFIQRKEFLNEISDFIPLDEKKKAQANKYLKSIFKSGHRRRFNKHKSTNQMHPQEEMPSNVNPFRQQAGSAG